MTMSTCAALALASCVTVTDSSSADDCDGTLETLSPSETPALDGIEGSAEQHVAALEEVHALRIRMADASASQDEVIGDLTIQFEQEGLYSRCFEELTLPGTFMLTVDDEVILHGEGEPTLGGFAPQYFFDAEGTPRFFELLGALDGGDEAGEPKLIVTPKSDNPNDFDFSFARCGADGWCTTVATFGEI